MTRGNLIHALKFDPVINSDAPIYESRFFIPFKAGVDIRDSSIGFPNVPLVAVGRPKCKRYQYSSTEVDGFASSGCR